MKRKIGAKSAFNRHLRLQDEIKSTFKHPLMIGFELQPLPISFFLLDFKNALTLEINSNWGGFSQFCKVTKMPKKLLKDFYESDKQPPSIFFKKLEKALKYDYLILRLDTFWDVRKEFRAALEMTVEQDVLEHSSLLVYLCTNSRGRLSHQLTRTEKLKLISSYMATISKAKNAA